MKSDKTPVYTQHETTLRNGLQVVGLRMPHLRGMVLAAFVRVGARCEGEEDKGISHFLEHIMLSGSRAYPTVADLFGAVESMGGTLNAASTYDHTVYWMRLHRDHLEQGVRVLADVLTRPLLDSDTIEAERGTILNEMAGLDGESPLELMYKMIWPGRSAAFNVPGSLETVESFDRERLWSHYRRYYVPGNMVLCVVGRFEVEPTFALIAGRLGQMEGQPAPAPNPLGEPQPGPRWISRPTGGTQVSFWLAQRAYPHPDPRRVQLHVLNALLGVGTRSLLFEKLREEAGLAYYVEADLSMESEFGILNIRCGLPDENLMSALEMVLGELCKLAEEPLEAGRLARAVELVRCQVEFQLDSPETMAMLFGLGALQDRALEPPLELARKVQAVTADEVMQVAREVFTPQRRYLLLLGPEGQMVRRRQVERLLAMGAGD